MGKVLFLSTVFFAAGFSFAQTDSNPPPSVEAVYTDSLETGHYKNMYRADSVLYKNPITENAVYPKQFKENIPSRYQGKDFDYTTVKPRMSFWEKLMAKIIKILDSISETRHLQNQRILPEF
ncbi:hypothetical protein ACFOEQ_20495 [Chryseobacterium arachidis]|uniref:hypothetical protein n=1 Tax=Chryseobacterium arachidis TaxID=1416778 RepID=UPI0036242EFF